MAPRLLLVGQGSQTSGYARVLRSLAPGLAAEFELAYFTVNLPRPVDVPGLSIPAARQGDVYGFRQLREILGTFRPDVMLVCHDAEVFGRYCRIALETAPDCKRVGYLPCEWGPVDPEVAAGLDEADLVVTYTRFGREMLSSAFAALGVPGPPISVLPHGVCTRTFHPLFSGAWGTERRARSRALARTVLFPRLEEDVFLILNANRCTPRKRLDLTVRLFSRVAAGGSPAALCLLHPRATSNGPCLIHLGPRGHLREERLDWPDSLDDTALNLLYNAADLGINTACAEAWGLTAVEHAAAGCAQAMPAHPSLLEIWDGAVVFLPHVRTPGVTGHGLVSIDSAGDVLAELRVDHARLRELDQAAYARVATGSFGWDPIAARWEELLTELLTGAYEPAE